MQTPLLHPTETKKLESKPSVPCRRFWGFTVAIALAFFILNAINAQAQTLYFFYSFDTTTDSVGSNFTSTVTAETFPGTELPSLTSVGTDTDTGGEVSFTAFDGTTWSGGSGGAGTPGHSLAWNQGGTGSFNLNFDATNLENFQLRMAIRSAANSGATPLSSFSDILYSTTGPGGTFTSAGFSLAQRSFTANNAFVSYTLDLSGISQISSQSDVSLQFTIPTVPANTSLRVDNIQMAASVIPEPSTAILISIALGTLALFGRRRPRPELQVNSRPSP